MRRACILLLLLSSGELFAQEPSPAETAVAREQFNLGLAAAKENRWDEAYDAFSRAYALTKSTAILFNLAAAEVKTGRWVEARETYRRFLREAGRDQAQAKAGAQRLLSTLEAEIPRAVITLEAASSDDAVSLDGRELPPALIGVEIPLNPGPHVLVRSRRDTEVARVEIEIAPLERRAIHLAAPEIAKAVPPPPPPPPPPPAFAEPAPPPVSQEGSLFSEPWFWITAAAIVIAGGAATGIVLATRDQEPYAGTTGIVLRGLEP